MLLPSNTTEERVERLVAAYGNVNAGSVEEEVTSLPLTAGPLWLGLVCVCSLLFAAM